MIIGNKEKEVLIKNFSKLKTILGLSFKNMIPQFISEQIIDFDEQSEITVDDLLKKIMKHLKDGDTNHFYSMLNIMKVCGKESDEELATAMEKSVSLKQ